MTEFTIVKIERIGKTVFHSECTNQNNETKLTPS